MWIRCDCCDDYWCSVHYCHVAKCCCPPEDDVETEEDDDADGSREEAD